MTEPVDQYPQRLSHLRAGVWLLVVLVTPTLLTMALLSRPRAGNAAISLQNTCLIAAIAVAAIGALDWRRDRSGRGATFAMLAAGSCGLIVLLIIWNKLFRHYIAVTGFTDNTFRSVFHTIYAPLYGRVQRAGPSWWIALMIAAVVLMLWEMSKSRPAIWQIALAQLALAIAYGGTEGLPRVASPSFAGFAPYEADLGKFSGLADLMSHYVPRMPELSHFESHYPPGFLLIFMAGKRLGVPLLLKGLSILLPVVALFPLRRLAREVGLGEKASTLAAALFASSAGILIFPTITPIAATAFFSCLCFWLLARAINKGGWLSASAFGLAYGLYFFFSFASYMPVAVMALFLLIGLINRSISIRRAASVLGFSIATFIFFFLCVYLLFHFDIIRCFRTAAAMHLLDPGHGFDSPVRYLFRSTGGIIAYLISTGYAVAILALAGTGRTADQNALLRAFAAATLLGILLCGFSGMSFLETERIWVMFTPALAVVAGAELEQREQREGKWLAAGVVLFALVFSCSCELLFRHHLAGIVPRG